MIGGEQHRWLAFGTSSMFVGLVTVDMRNNARAVRHVTSDLFCQSQVGYVSLLIAHREHGVKPLCQRQFSMFKQRVHNDQGLISAGVAPA